MASHHVMRTNAAVTPARFEWLSAVPKWRADGELDTTWTADPTKARAFSRKNAAEWAAIVDGGSTVRFGEPDPEDVRDFDAEERAVKREARRQRILAMTPQERAAAGIPEPTP